VIYKKFDIEQCKNVLPVGFVARHALVQAIMDRQNPSLQSTRGI